MADDDTDTTVPSGTEFVTQADSEKEKRIWTQEQANEAMGEARVKGRSSGQKEVFAELGVESLDDLKAIVTSAREAEEAQKSELERARDEAQEAKRQAAEASASAARADMILRVNEAMLAAGFPADRISRAHSLLDVQTGDGEEEIKAAVEACKEEFPELFTTADGSPPARSWAPKGGTGEKTKQKTSGKSGVAKGLERFAAMKGES